MKIVVILQPIMYSTVTTNTTEQLVFLAMFNLVNIKHLDNNWLMKIEMDFFFCWQLTYSWRLRVG
jgi:hypothetical protein